MKHQPIDSDDNEANRQCSQRSVALCDAKRVNNNANRPTDRSETITDTRFETGGLREHNETVRTSDGTTLDSDFGRRFVATVDAVDVVRQLEEDVRRRVLGAAGETGEATARDRLFVVDHKRLHLKNERSII